MDCGKSKETGSQWYSFWKGKFRVTLFPEYPNKLEMSITVFKWYKVFHFGYDE